MDKMNDNNQKFQPLPRYSVSAREAAEMIGVSKSTVFNLMEDGSLPFLMVGSRKLLMIKDIEAYLEEKRQRGKKDEEL